MKTTILILLSSLMLAQATPVTVRFDDADRGPSDSLNIGGVDVSMEFGQVSTKAGVGLGAGSDSLISFTVWYGPDNGLVLFQDYSGAVFSAPGQITDISLTPFFYPVVPPSLSDRWEVVVAASVAYFPTTDGAAICFLMNKLTGVGFDNYNPDDGIDYWENAQMFSWGFSVASLTYEAVPEPSTWMLLAGGLAVFVWIKFKPQSA